MEPGLGGADFSRDTDGPQCDRDADRAGRSRDRVAVGGAEMIKYGTSLIIYNRSGL